MKLRTYLEEKNIKAREFATNVGLSLPAVYKYLNGERTPDKETMPRIVAATSGQVTANDFYDIPQPDSPKPPSHLNGGACKGEMADSQ